MEHEHPVRRTRSEPTIEVGPRGGAVPGDIESQLRRESGRGEPLPASARSPLEQHFGRSLDDVRIHRDSELAPRLGATAFTSGRDIHFAPGRYDPTSRSGTWLLAHELTHVEQQTSRIHRNGWFDSVVGTLDRAALRVRYVTTWDAATLDSVIDHFGLERFKHLTDVLGAGPVAAIGAPTLLQASATDPFALPTLSFKQRFAVAVGWAMPIATLRQAVAAASQAERDTVWQDDALLATMRRQFPLDDYLALLPQLRVLMPGKGKKPVDQWGTYDSATLGPEVDRVITTELGHYVGGAVTAGRHVEGEVSVVGDDDWQLAFKRQWKKKQLQPHMATANAFVDVNQPARHIWIHKDRGGAGTAIHEGFHKYASPVLRDRLIDDFRGGGNDVCNLDEGLTEYFTRTVITSAGLGFPRSSYPSQFKSVTKLLTKISEATLAKAYFDGDMGTLRAEFLTKVKRNFDDYAKALEANDYTTADGML